MYSDTKERGCPPGKNTFLGAALMAQLLKWIKMTIILKPFGCPFMLLLLGFYFHLGLHQILPCPMGGLFPDM